MEWIIGIVVAIWLPLTLVCGWVASQKNRNGYGHWLASALFSPAFWILVLIALPALPQIQPRQIAGDRVEPTF